MSIRLYGELSEMTDLGREIYKSVIDAANPLADSLADKNVDLRDARQITVDAVSTAFALKITELALKDREALLKRSAEIKQKEGDKS